MHRRIAVAALAALMASALVQAQDRLPWWDRIHLSSDSHSISRAELFGGDGKAPEPAPTEAVVSLDERRGQPCLERLETLLQMVDARVLREQERERAKLRTPSQRIGRVATYFAGATVAGMAFPVARRVYRYRGMRGLRFWPNGLIELINFTGPWLTGTLFLVGGVENRFDEDASLLKKSISHWEMVAGKLRETRDLLRRARDVSDDSGSAPESDFMHAVARQDKTGELCRADVFPTSSWLRSLIKSEGAPVAESAVSDRSAKRPAGPPASFTQGKAVKAKGGL